jgi:hypothetical protein
MPGNEKDIARYLVLNKGRISIGKYLVSFLPISLVSREFG